MLFPTEAAREVEMRAWIDDYDETKTLEENWERFCADGQSRLDFYERDEQTLDIPVAVLIDISGGNYQGYYASHKNIDVGVFDWDNEHEDPAFADCSTKAQRVEVIEAKLETLKKKMNVS